ncbi:MAG TPA: HAD family hydrolase [Candidatus Dormibacteraeota bacterium]|nr:HAD family hydrolase [Candidatus Dormibacteraeota bacterium]
MFDFDGLIVDTEGPIFEAWQRIYRERGHELPRERWLTIIGTASAAFDPVVDLGQRVGETLDPREFDALERLYYRETTVEQQLLPGVERYLADAHGLGLKTAIASSSTRKWVTEHLERFGLGEMFDTVVCREDVEKTKPDPALYRVAVARLECVPAEAVALEDSSNGIRAAKAAGLFCVAVPNPLTASMDLRAADLRLESLDRLSLAELLERVEA